MHKIYNDSQILDILNDLLSYPWDGEAEWLEFKDANDNFSTPTIGKYFSALSNEANLLWKDYGRLIFGVQNKTKNIIWTNYRSNPQRLQDLKRDIANSCNISFIHIYELNYEGHRLLMFQIPPAIPWIPTGCNGHYFWRDGENIWALHDNERDIITNQSRNTDRTAQTKSELSINDLDINAINVAREWYQRKHPDINMDDRDNETFLVKSRMLYRWEITNACALLLWKSEVISSMYPRLEISWILKDLDGTVLQHIPYKPPFILSTQEIIQRIRKIPQTFLPEWSLMPIEINPYDNWVLRELLANAICHQDYSLQWRIWVLEFPDYLIISNPWSFFSWSIELVVLNKEFMPSHYRNPFLKEIMSEIKMIEYAGSGLRRIFNYYKDNRLPLPTDNSNSDIVKVRLEGKIIDERYTTLLKNLWQSLSLEDIINLDKVQKWINLENIEIRQLRNKKLISGRKPNYYITLEVAQRTWQVKEHLLAKWLDISTHKERILELLRKSPQGVSPEIIIDFINKYLWDTMNLEQKKKRINNSLQDLRRKWLIDNNWKRGKSCLWFLQPKPIN